jgi:putative hydrolase of the HAD superfamily
MSIRAVLFDVGGPLDTEILHEQYVDKYLRRAVRAVGCSPTDEEFAAASAAAVTAYAPDAYAAMAWQLCGQDPDRTREALRLFQREWSAERAAERGGMELRPGIAELLRRLHERGLLLGLAANQPARIIEELDRHGIGELFGHREVSGHHGYRKPDVRLFLRACEDLGVEPLECVMVGDRIDNDIFPARLLGMRTVLFRTGRHIEQRPRTLDEIPDAVVTNIDELESAILALCAKP